MVMLSTILDSCLFLRGVVFHKGNKLAHALTHRAVSFANFDVWLEDLPYDLDDIFKFDLP